MTWGFGRPGGRDASRTSLPAALGLGGSTPGPGITRARHCSSGQERVSQKRAGPSELWGEGCVEPVTALPRPPPCSKCPSISAGWGPCSPPSQPIAPLHRNAKPLFVSLPRILFPGQRTQLVADGRTDGRTDGCLGAGLGLAAYLWGCGRSRSRRAALPCPRSRRTSGREAKERAELGTSSG